MCRNREKNKTKNVALFQEQRSKVYTYNWIVPRFHIDCNTCQFFFFRISLGGYFVRCSGDIITTQYLLTTRNNDADGHRYATTSRQSRSVIGRLADYVENLISPW